MNIGKDKESSSVTEQNGLILLESQNELSQECQNIHCIQGYFIKADTHLI